MNNNNNVEIYTGLKKWYHSNRQKPWMRSMEALARHRLAQIGIVGFIFITIVTVFAPAIAPMDPFEMDFGALKAAPSADHWFGTDDLGRDILSRVIWGGRESLRAGYLAVIIGLAGGVIVGLVTGYVGGWLDDIVQRLVEIVYAFPNILLLLSIVAALGPNLTTIIIAIGFGSIPGYTRLLRGSVIQAKNFEYVTSAKLVGAKSMRIMFKHILPNIIAPILIFGTISLAGAIMMTAGLSYLGLGAQPPSPEWGAALNEGRDYLRIAPWMSFFPGMAVFLAMLFVNLIGNGMRDALDPKTRQEGG
jgi:peptide/nickel transport system permease protein